MYIIKHMRTLIGIWENVVNGYRCVQMTKYHLVCGLPVHAPAESLPKLHIKKILHIHGILFRKMDTCLLPTNSHNLSHPLQFYDIHSILNIECTHTPGVKNYSQKSQTYRYPVVLTLLPGLYNPSVSYRASLQCWTEESKHFLVDSNFLCSLMTLMICYYVLILCWGFVT